MKTWIFTFLLLGYSAALFATQDRKTIELRLQSPTGNLSTVTVYFDEGVTNLYNSSQDALMVFSKVPGVPQVYGLTVDTVPCSVLAYGNLSATATVQLGYVVGYDGLYNISAIEIDNFDPTSIITLEDRVAGKTIDLRENFYQVNLDSSVPGDGRFYLHVTYPVQTGSVNSNCENLDGMINLLADTTFAWNTCQLLNSQSEVLVTDSNVEGALSFDGLQSGTYEVAFNYGQYTAYKSIAVNGNYVVAGIQPPSQPIYTNQDVIFSAVTGNANQYTWDFGDSTIIEGVANAGQVYLQPGQYTVTLYCTNDSGCSSSAQVVVSVYTPAGINNATQNPLKIYSAQKEISVNLNEIPSPGAQVNVYNLLGQTLLARPLVQPLQVFNMAEAPSGYYLVSVTNNGRQVTQKVLLAQ